MKDAPPESVAVGKLLKVWLDHRTDAFKQPINGTRARFRALFTSNHGHVCVGTCPHDPLTVCEAIYPGRFVRYSRGQIVVHQEKGNTSFVLNVDSGPHTVGIESDKPAFLRWLTDVLLKGMPGPVRAASARSESKPAADVSENPSAAIR